MNVQSIEALNFGAKLPKSKRIGLGFEPGKRTDRKIASEQRYQDAQKKINALKEQLTHTKSEKEIAQLNAEIKNIKDAANRAYNDINQFS